MTCANSLTEESHRVHHKNDAPYSLKERKRTNTITIECENSPLEDIHNLVYAENMYEQSDPGISSSAIPAEGPVHSVPFPQQYDFVLGDKIGGSRENTRSRDPLKQEPQERNDTKSLELEKLSITRTLLTSNLQSSLGGIRSIAHLVQPGAEPTRNPTSPESIHRRLSRFHDMTRSSVKSRA